MSGSNSPGNTSNSPTGDTGLNFVLQNATSGGGSGTEQDGQQQFTGLATLNKLLQQQPESEQQQQQPEQQQTEQQEEHTENETQNDQTNDDDAANQQQQEASTEDAEPTDQNETTETVENNHTEEEALAATAVPSAEGYQRREEKEDQQQQETKEETQNDDTKKEEETNNSNSNNNIVRLDIGTGSYENGHFHFQTSRAATGEALHRVFHFSNRTAATATSLVPQIAPHLAQGGNNAYRHRLRGSSAKNHDDMLDDSSSSHGKTGHSNKKLEKLVQLQREHEDKYKSYNAASSSSTGENTNKEGSGNKEEGGGGGADTGHYSGYRPYSLRSPLSAHHQHMSPEQNNTPDGAPATSTSTSAQHHNQHQQNHHSPRHHNFVGYSRDLFGLHCLFDACKDLISEKPKKLPKLRISGVQREVDDVSNSKAATAAAGGSGSTEEQQQQQSGGGSTNETGDDTTQNNNNNNTGKPSHLSISQIQKQKRILHHHVSSNQHQTTRDQLISWLTPWPFEIEATADKNTASKFNQQQMDKFNPISPIFTEPAISPNSIAFQLAVSVRVAAQEEERQRELLQQQQEAQEEAHRLAQALAQQHGGEEEGDNTNNDDGENGEDEKKETESSTSPGGKQQQQQTTNTKKSSSNANAGGGFLPRGFQVSSIPSVLPSLLTVTSARNPAGIHQQEQDNNKKGENVDWSSPSSPGQQHQPHPPQQQVKILGENTSGRKTLTGGENSARMRNRAKLWSTTLSSVGMLIPAELTHSMKFEKHKDVKQLENKTEKLRHELEHFKTMRRIRSGQNSSDHHQSSSARDNFRSHMWQTNQKTATTARNSSSSGKADMMNNTRPATPPRSFLASHGLRSAQQQQGGDQHHAGGGTGGLHLPPIHNNNNISGKDGGMIATTVMNHPPVPWSRQIATGSSNLSARFTAGKYERPERANLVAALMD